MFKGTFTALVSPYTPQGELDIESFHSLLETQIKGGVTGLVPVGTTGESPTLSHKENIQLVEETIAYTKGSLPIIAGTGSNSTLEALEMTQIAKEIGATASLQVVPYYNKPTQEGMYRHFMSIADSIDLPLIVYNIMGRTGINMATSTLMRLADHPNIVGVKEASGNINQMMDIIAQRPQDFCVLSGDDALSVPLIAMGGDGVISVASNIIPSPVSQCIEDALAGKQEEARTQHYKLLALFQAMFMESNPIVVKESLALMNVIKSASFRLPMSNISAENLVILKKILKKYGLL